MVIRWAALLGHKMVQTLTRGVADIVQAERWDSTRTGQWAWQLDRGSLVTWKQCRRFIVVPSLHDVLCCLENTYTEMVLPRQENQHSLQADIDANIQAASDHTVDVNAQVSDSI